MLRSALLLGTALTLGAGPAVAQSSTSTYLTPMVISTGWAWSGIGDPFRVTGSVSAIGADEIAQFGGQNLDDVLRATAGTFTRDNVQNQGIAVNLRGLEGSGRVNMMIDGVKQSFRFTGHEAQGFTYIDPAFISGIDITRGANTGVGGGALAGSANFRTIGVIDLLDGKEYGGFITGTAGDNGSGWVGAAAGAVQINETFAILAGVSKRNSDDYGNGNGDIVSYTAQDNLSGIVKLELTPDAYQKLTLSGLFYTNDFFANSYFQTVTNRTLSANYEYRPDDNPLVDFRANAYLNNTRMEYTTNLTGGGAAAGRELEDAGRGFDVSNTSEFDLGPIAVESNYGIEYFLDEVTSMHSSTVTGPGINPSGTSSTAAAFLSTKFSYDLVDLTLGARYDHFTIDGSGTALAGNPIGMPPGPYEVHRNEGRINPKVTLALNPTDWFQPYFIYGETMRAPTISETMMGGEHPNSGTVAYANPFLRPEVSRGIEAGANFNFDSVVLEGDSVKLKANYYRNYIDDYITGRLSPSFGFYFDNNPGTSLVQGVELQGAYDAGVMFASLAYTYTNSELPTQINGAGAQSYLPEHIFAATLGARLLEDQSLTLGGRLYAVSESFVGQINADLWGTPLYHPGYMTVDLFANYELENGIELGATISNIFDTVYTPALSTPASGSAVPTGRGRTVQLTAKATF